VAREESFDPGLTQKFEGRIRRTINKDGSFNVRKIGTKLHDVNPYLYLVSISWARFAGVIFAGFLLANLAFAELYYLGGRDCLRGADTSSAQTFFESAFFFSTQTLTTVGYGAVAPNGRYANSIAAVEATMGLLGFALATGLLVGRVSQPSARIAYSDNCLITAYEDITSLQFRIANQRRNNVMELEATIILMLVDECSNGLRRDYFVLPLVRKGVYFFPVTWTIVHPIDKDSPLFGKTAKDLERLQAELLILIKGFDETFGQEVLSRYSYTYDEFIWGGSFAPAFHVDTDCDVSSVMAAVPGIELDGLRKRHRAHGRMHEHLTERCGVERTQQDHPTVVEGVEQRE
jgi:inward rectifier potassium channel